MIKIVITGFDNKIGPGDIVGAFINECGVNSDDIGKIEINSRQAEVELDDKIAAKVVKVMDENKIGGNRVKVRAKNVDYLLPEDLLRYIENSKRKLEEEQSYFEKEYNYLKKEIDTIKRLRSGVAINGLKAREENWIDSNNFIVTLFHQMPGQLLPVSRFKPGDFIELSAENIDRAVSGQIYEINKASILIAINQELPEILKGKNLILNISYNASYYKRLLESVESLERTSDISEKLKDTFLLNRGATFRAEKIEADRDFTFDFLSDEQKEAVVRAEAADDFYLIAGPAGSGKTTVISELILNSLKSGEKLLVISKLNSTLERLYNLVEDRVESKKMARTGIYNKESWSGNKAKDLDILFANPLDLDNLKDFNEFDLVIFEDGYLYSEAELIDPISGSKKAIIAGDLKGIKAESLAIDNYSDPEKEPGYFPGKYEDTPEELKSWLKQEYRYPSAIGDFVSNYVYRKQIIKSRKDLNRGKIDLDKFSFTESHPLFSLLDTEQDYVFLDTSSYQSEERKVEGLKDYYNRFEADIVEEAVELFINIGYEPEEIGVISPFNYQLIEIKKRLVNYDIKVETPYNFQGDERRIILVSTVRSNETGYLGRLRSIEELYITLTRSLERTIIVGNLPTLKNNQLYRRLLDNIDVKTV
ncbi:MAG: AAA domain-containing protein [Bacillota bacterium]